MGSWGVSWTSNVGGRWVGKWGNEEKSGMEGNGGGKGEGPNWSVGYNNIRIITTKPALGHTRTIINNNCLNFSHMTKCYYHMGW